MNYLANEILSNLTTFNRSTVFQIAILSSIIEQKIPGTDIPAIIHQYWNDDLEMDSNSQISNQKWIALNQDYIYLMWDDNDIVAFLQAFYPDHIYRFFQLSSTFLKETFFKYLILQKYGGVYAAINTEPTYSLSEWITQSKLNHAEVYHSQDQNYPIRFISGVESANTRSKNNFDLAKIEISPVMIASSPGHAVLEQMTSTILNNNVRRLMDPNQWTRIILNFWKDTGFNPIDFKNLGLKSIIIDDQLFLPFKAFESKKSNTRNMCKLFQIIK